jgi:hypothetical protein
MFYKLWGLLISWRWFCCILNFRIINFSNSRPNIHSSSLDNARKTKNFGYSYRKLNAGAAIWAWKGLSSIQICLSWAYVFTIHLRHLRCWNSVVKTLMSIEYWVWYQFLHDRPTLNFKKYYKNIPEIASYTIPVNWRGVHVRNREIMHK